MSRYSTSTIKRANSDSPRTIATTIIQATPFAQKDVYIQTTSIERLDKLANTFYQDATMWWAIAAANGLGKGTFIVPANTKLRIPDIDNIQRYINDINGSR
jgi:hypothetical protein